MLGHYYIMMTYYLDSKVLRFSVVWIYWMATIRYQLILQIDIKWLLLVAMGS